jgi:hypothetical protein
VHACVCACADVFVCLFAGGQVSLVAYAPVELRASALVDHHLQLFTPTSKLKYAPRPHFHDFGNP